MIFNAGGDIVAKSKLATYTREFRMKKGFTQKEFALISDLSVVSVSKIENGEHIGLQTQKKLAKVFEVEPERVREMMNEKEEE